MGVFEVYLEYYHHPWFYSKLEFNISYLLLKKMSHILKKKKGKLEKVFKRIYSGAF